MSPHSERKIGVESAGDHRFHADLVAGGKTWGLPTKGDHRMILRRNISRNAVVVAFLCLLLSSAGCGYRYYTECEEDALQRSGIMARGCPGPIPYLTQSQVGVRDPATGHYWVAPAPDGLWNLWGLLPVQLTILGFGVAIVVLLLIVQKAAPQNDEDADDEGTASAAPAPEVASAPPPATLVERARAFRELREAGVEEVEAKRLAGLEPDAVESESHRESSDPVRPKPRSGRPPPTFFVGD